MSTPKSSPKTTPKGTQDTPKDNTKGTPNGTPKSKKKVIKPDNIVKGLTSSLFGKSSKRNSYEIRVKTRDFQLASCDSNVYCAIIGNNDDRSTDLLLDNIFRDDLERGREDKFSFSHVEHIDIIGVELWRAGSNNLKDNWFCEYLLVQHTECDQEEPCSFQGVSMPFPVHRWINSGQKYHLYLYNSCLPQFDTIPARELNRMEETKQRKDDYKYEKVTGLPRRVASLPASEGFAPDYQGDIRARKRAMYLEKKMQEWFHPNCKWDTFEDMEHVYKNTFQLPKGWYNWKDDFNFGDQRLNGPNTTQLRLCEKIPPNFPVTDEMVASSVEGSTLNELMQQRRLFICDLSVLEGVKTFDGDEIAIPLALFFANKKGKLLPIAIQLFQEPAEDNPIFLPSDPEYTWMLAKMYYNNADANIHQTCNHLGLTHFLCESICCAVNQSLPTCHPVYQLMAPHFIYLLAINSSGLKVLMETGGFFDAVMTIGSVGFDDLLKKRWDHWRLDVDGWLPADIESRGVGDKEVLTHYYFRDDALLLHNAIVDYVTDVLSGVYDTPQKLLQDHEVQNFASTLVDEKDGAGLKGVFGGGRFDKLEDLIKVVSATIFVASVGHAAANFGQYDEYAFAPAYPGKLTGELPRDKKPRTLKDIISKLPNKENTLNTMLIMHLLSQRDTNLLGNFEIQFLYEPKAVAAVKRFQDNLDKVGAIIDERNKNVEMPYPYLHPKEIPNAISI